MAFSSSWLFNADIADSTLFSSSIMDSFAKIVDGVPTGLAGKLGVPDLDGDEPGLKMIGGLTISSFGLVYCLLSWSLEVCLFMPATFAAALSCEAVLLSEGPVKRCTTSLKVFVSVCTKVVNGLQPAAPWLAGFSMDVYLIWQAWFPNQIGPNLQKVFNFIMVSSSFYSIIFTSKLRYIFWCATYGHVW